MKIKFIFDITNDIIELDNIQLPQIGNNVRFKCIDSNNTEIIGWFKVENITYDFVDDSIKVLCDYYDED